MTRVRKPRTYAAGALILGALAFAAFGVNRIATDSTKPVPNGSALSKFRVAEKHPAGYEGVYTYETTGKESVDALTGATHHYPATTTITVIRKGCGVRLQWDALDGRSTTWTLCTSHDTVTLRGLRETHTFFKRADHTNYTCTQSGTRFTCTSPKGGESGDVTPLGERMVSVHSVLSASLVIRTVATVTGQSHGTETTEWWLAPRTLLPLRLVVASRTSRREPLVGTVHYREDAKLALVSRTPSR